MIRFTKEAISDFVRRWTLVIPYEIFIQIFVSIGLLPIVSFGIKRVLVYSGREAAGNLDIFLSFRNVPGILFLILSVFLLGYLILIEIGGILFIETANLKNEKITLVDVVGNAHGFWRKLFSPGIICLHDSDLKRTAGKNQKIWDLRKEELKEVDVGSWFSSEYSNQGIATLDEVLQYTKGKILLNIELKPNGDEDALVKEVVRLIQKQHMEEEVILTSLQYDILTLAKEMDSDIKTGYVFFSTIGDLFSYEVDVYSIEAQFLSEGLVEEIHQKGKAVHVWTVNDQEEATKFALYEVDSIITDEPKMVKEAVRQVEQMTVQERFLELMYLVE